MGRKHASYTKGDRLALYETKVKSALTGKYRMEDILDSSYKYKRQLLRGEKNMVSSLTKDEIYTYMKHQIDMLFYDKYKFGGGGFAPRLIWH